MLTRVAAQGLTDVLAATALGSCVMAALRRGVRSPLGLRIVFAFGGLTLFFVCRGASEGLQNPFLGTMAEVLAAALPIAGLALAEGLLRRHAPRLLKAAITLGAMVMMLALILVAARPPVSSWGLGGYVTLSILALVVLLIARDRASLSHQENARIDTLMLAGAALAALGLTDFLGAAPIGMSGLGAALLALFAHYNANSRNGVGRALRELLVIGVAAGVFTACLIWAVPLSEPGEAARVAVVVLTLMIALITLIDALREHAGQDEAVALRKALAGSDTTSLSGFLDSLAGHPLLRDVRLVEGGPLADYDPVALAAAFSSRMVRTRKSLRETGEPVTAGRDELLDLMAGADASHAALVSRQPLRIALLTLPEIGPAEETDADIALFCKLAASAAEARP